MSLGQTRSVLVGFLLVSGQTSPLVVDQPEDHLDAPFLASTVVGYLHTAKESRQVVVATHNANITVLGDAELVVPLEVVGGRGEVKDAGSVDASATREKVLSLLEGGRDAYRHRGERYGFEFRS